MLKFVGSGPKMVSPPIACLDVALFGRTRSRTGPERRRTRRAPLHWTLFLACTKSGPLLRTVTRDINKDGFYCLLNQPVNPGEQIECDIVVPTHGPQDHDDVIYLRCLVQTVRVEKIGTASEFGVACRIENYYLVGGGRRREGE